MQKTEVVLRRVVDEIITSRYGGSSTAACLPKNKIKEITLNERWQRLQNRGGRCLKMKVDDFETTVGTI